MQAEKITDRYNQASCLVVKIATHYTNELNRLSDIEIAKKKQEQSELLLSLYEALSPKNAPASSDQQLISKLEKKIIRCELDLTRLQAGKGENKALVYVIGMICLVMNGLRIRNEQFSCW